MWTKQQEVLLAKYISEGHTYRQIAIIMRKSKNSVLGKANRLKLPYLAKKEKEEVCKLAVVKRPVYKHIVNHPDAPPSRNLTVAELEKDDCRFIAGEDRLFCGHKIVEGSSYCAHHKELCLIPLQQTSTN